MRFLTMGAIASTSATFLLTLNGWPVQAQGIVPATDGTGTQVTPNGPDYSITGGSTSADNQNLFHRFTDFNLLTGESATFITQPEILNILSGVTGNNPSLIDGLLQVSGSNANLFLINPNGILMGPNSALNLQGSFTATTANQINFADGLFDLTGNSDYATLVGAPQSFGFTLDSPASVVTAGNLAVAPGETIMLLGGQVLNTGTLTAPGGEVVISAVEGSNLVRIAQTGSLLNLELETLATGNEAATPFSPLTLPELLTGSAIAAATNVTVNADGTIQLGEATVAAQSGSAIVSGEIDVEQTQGGTVLVLGRAITLTDAVLAASGHEAGGNVRIGGDYQGQGGLPRAQTTWIDANTVIQADALDAGNGGEVIVWADGTTLFQGLITARGGPNGGDGGLVETSGRETVTVTGGRVFASAPQGTAGEWFVDPSNIFLGGDIIFAIQDALEAGTNFTASTIEGAIADETGTPGGEGDIFLEEDINADAINGATLTLTASRYLQSEGEVGPSVINIFGDGNLILNLNQEGLAEIDNPTINDALEAIGTIEGITEINLGAGTYREPEPIFLTSGMRLQGSGAANTILDGSDSGPISVSAISLPGLPETQINNLSVANSFSPEGPGGGINNFGNLVINNSVIRNNQADATGGGIANTRFEFPITPDEGTLVINNSTIRNNQSGGDGGGISNAGGTVTINNSTIHDNTAGDDGGGVDNNNAGGTVTINNSTLFGNAAAAEGGGAENDSLMTIANSTIVGNTAAIGGGISNTLDSSTLILTSSLVSGNTATGGPANNVFNGGSLSSSNNLFGANGTPGIAGFEVTASDIVPAVPLGDIISTVLTNNGGPTQTLALVAGSPAIDAGNGSGTDQRGFPLSGGSRDIGAFEFQGDAGGGSSGGDENFECVAGDCNPPTLPPETAPETRRDSSEPSYVQQFEEHLGVEASAFEDLDALDRARNITGVTPAIAYASFVPPSDEAETATTEATLIADAGLATKGLVVDDALGQQIVAQAEGRQERTTATAAEDVLQLVLVTSDNTPRRINTGVTRSEVLAAVQQLQIELTDRTRRRLDNYLIPSQALYSWLVAPLEQALAAEDIGHISFVLDEGLRSLPMAALHDGEQFIIENYSVGLMPSLSLTDTRIGNIRNAAVLAMGASEFSNQPPLPAVPFEIATISELRVSESYLNETFTPETLVTERAEEAYPILHLATHGQFTSGELSNSYIQFWDQQLGLDELPQLQLGEPAVELMVLSACRTVLGDSEAELGFAGLAIKSGAKSAIAALWQVSDLETAGLMAELYTQVGQVNYKAEALRQAQLAMLRGDVVVQNDQLVWSGGSKPLPDELSGSGFADTQHPYYWAAFTLVGNPW